MCTVCQPARRQEVSGVSVASWPSLSLRRHFTNPTSPLPPSRLPHHLFPPFFSPHEKTKQSISRIPQSTLKELIPVLQGIPADKLTTQLKTLAAQDKATIDKMVYFLKAVSLLSLFVVVVHHCRCVQQVHCA